MPRWKPPHPRRHIHPPPPCPTQPRYPTQTLALNALPTAGDPRLTATPCGCGGWHHTPTRPIP